MTPVSHAERIAKRHARKVARAPLPRAGEGPGVRGGAPSTDPEPDREASTAAVPHPAPETSTAPAGRRGSADEPANPFAAFMGCAP